MRLLIQRVTNADVTIENEVRATIGSGLLIFVGIEHGDTLKDVEWLAAKTVNMRIFNDENGVMNRSLLEIGGEALVVSQFTLTASTKKGNRPSYIRAANHELAVPLYEEFCRQLSSLLGREVKTGVFGADMKISLINDGPVTIIIDSRLKE